MGKSTINGNFQQQTVSLPEGKEKNGGKNSGKTVLGSFEAPDF